MANRYNYAVIKHSEPATYFREEYIDVRGIFHEACFTDYEKATICNTQEDANKLLIAAKKELANKYDTSTFEVKKLYYDQRTFRKCNLSELEQIGYAAIIFANSLNRIVQDASFFKEHVEIQFAYANELERKKIYSRLHTFKYMQRIFGYPRVAVFDLTLKDDVENNIFTLSVNKNPTYKFNHNSIINYINYTLPECIYNNVSYNSKDIFNRSCFKFCAKINTHKYEQYPTISNETSSTLKNNTKRKYYLPKYVCYDKAESRNRERNVFQTQLHINGKLYKNNLYTVKDALIYNVKNMLEHTDIWPLDKIADYIKTYDPEMENGNFIPSNTPKSPSVRKREKAKSIKQIKEAVNEKLKDLLKFAKDNDIDINVNIK